MPVSKALLGENVHSELLSSTTHRQQSNKVQSRKNIDFRLKKINEKYLKAIILLSARHSWPTLYGSKPAQKAEVGLCFVFLRDVWQEVAVLSLCLDRSYRESTVTVRCFFVVFLFLLCFIAHLYEANGGTDMEVLACFRPGFSHSTRPGGDGELGEFPPFLRVGNIIAETLRRPVGVFGGIGQVFSTRRIQLHLDICKVCGHTGRLGTQCTCMFTFITG